MPSSRYRYCRAILLILIIGAITIAGEAADRTNPIYDGAIDFGSQLAQLNDGCIAFDGTVKSGNFFGDLKRKDIGSQLEFRKRGKVVTEYPESLTTLIRIAGDRCAATLLSAPSSIFRADSYSVKFEVEWKKGMQLRPAVLSVAHCIGSSSVSIPSQGFTTPLITCRMTVDSKGVPLADHLIVSVFAADGKRLTRLSARP
jgi:hypothetical protein